jgi:hypothetical protein
VPWRHALYFLGSFLVSTGDTHAFAAQSAHGTPCSSSQFVLLVDGFFKVQQRLLVVLPTKGTLPRPAIGQGLGRFW